MEIKSISLQDFESVLAVGNRRASYGQNQILLRKAETEAVALQFDSEPKAISKLTALYVVRRKMGAQVKIVRRGQTLYVGPGEYVPSMRRGKK